jgi:serine phosphatase RsbU (regulator of sigma subunit)/HAMP domain-containing protein
MKSIRLSISRRIALGFGLFILVVAVLFLITTSTLRQSREINNRINGVFVPSLSSLQELDNHLMRTQDLARQWAFVQRLEDDQERIEMVQLCEKVIPAQLYKLQQNALNWNDEDKKRHEQLVSHVRELLASYKDVRTLLPSFESYQDPLATMDAEQYFLAGGQIPTAYAEVRNNIDQLIQHQQQYMNSDIALMNNSFDQLKMLLINISISVIIAGILIAFFTSRSIVKPINHLRKKLQNLSLGIYSVHPTKAGNDEIGDMANAVNRLITNFEKTKEFSMSVGAGHFDVSFEPLSEHDELGSALIRMRNDLQSYRNEMEEKVKEQTQEIRKQKEEVEIQKEKVTALYIDLQSSIDYAQRLQETILPNDTSIKRMFSDSFVLFRPKATVSGDFYWFKELGGKKVFAAADCTGHGVPGAFMSLVGHNVLNTVTKVFTRPSQILNNANRLAVDVLRSSDGESYMRDGMDIALCTIDPKTKMLEFSGAHNPAYIIRNGEMIIIDSDPFSIGSYVNNEREFTNHNFQLETGDCLYLFSDGYVDQFGGPKGKKFMRKQFRQLLLDIAHLPMPEQKWRLTDTLDRWQGQQEQVDDILVIGIKIEEH